LKGTFLLFVQEKLATVFSAASAIGKRTGMSASLPDLRPSTEFQCRFLQGVYILLDGEVVPCCHMLPGAYPCKKVSFGSTSERPLAEIGKSFAYRAFREGIPSGDYPEVCMGCPYATGFLT
jgi:hypothetical protein